MNRNWLKKFHFLDFLALLSAFIYGNLFAIHNSEMNWGFALIFCIVVFLEFINQTLYFFREKHTLVYPYVLVNTLKRGFLLGFFVEAFKVGS